MDVRFRSFSLSSIVLNGVAALPAVYPFVLNTLVYFGGDISAFQTAFQSQFGGVLPTPIVSLRFLSCYASTNSVPRHSNSSRSELPQLASAMDTN
jgi:hypothetical protein